jgi:hypothetical protein
MVGIKKDRPIETQQITLVPFHGVYFPLNPYYSSDPLPIEWLEILEQPFGGPNF